MRKLGLLLLAACILIPATANAMLVADSVAEFSGVQGQDNWEYCYYTGPFNWPAAYDLSHVYRLPLWDGSVAWHYTMSPPPWTMLASDWGHPNAEDQAGTARHWAVRRWTSDVTGLATISGFLAKRDPGGGDGVIGRVFVGGRPVYTRWIAYNDATGVNYSITVPVAAGAPVDLVIDPFGNTGYDSTYLTGRVNTIPTRIIADSVAEFSSTQGQSNWYYGYYAPGGNPNTFGLMTWSSANSRWEGPAADLALWPDGGHPGGDLHWSVRRWIAEVDGEITIDGAFRRNNSETGNDWLNDGIAGHIYLNGNEIWQEGLDRWISQGVINTDTTPFSLTLTVHAGDRIDFGVDPRTIHWYDGFDFFAAVSTNVPEPATMSLLGAGLLALAARRRRR